MFVGEKSAGNIPGASDALNKAKARADDGDHMPAIFNGTDWFKGEDGRWRREVPDKDMKLTGHLKEGGGAVPFDKAVKHDELFKADPDLKNSTVEVKDLPGFEGGYDRDNRRIYVRNPNDLKTIAHEKQHDIQFGHGLTPGTTPQAAGGVEAYENNLGEVEARDVESRMNNSDIKKKPKLCHKAG